MTARYIMLGGFLGAGKSTTVARLARWLTDRGHRVGLVTNDQGTGLVDTLNLRGQGFDVEEIAGGCFCCRFDSLKTAADRLTRDTRPDVFLAEPVGSCTDLVATVSYPLRRLYGDDYLIAPLSVLLDPVRALRILGLREGRGFSPKVRYVYEKQMEEADILVVNKIDRIEDEARTELVAALTERYPRAMIRAVSARRGDGLDPWFSTLVEAVATERPTMALDYQRYGEGEALLGWLNGTLVTASGAPFDPNEILMVLTRRLQERLGQDQIEIAHLKMTLVPADGPPDVASISLVREDSEPELTHELADPVTGARIVVNLRAEADPRTLEAGFRALAARQSGEPPLDIEHLESFRPGQPVPTHRIEVSS